MPTPTEAPEAQVAGFDHRAIIVNCPYCAHLHRHDRKNLPSQGRTRRAAGCGLHSSQEARVTGYWITLPTNPTRETAE
ncbi:hypothetical protein J2X01_000720 [Arthrobacter ginsengisoli]|uniref:Uncharacterized protein n=2 Tax=Arthrobacter ginsengisoli TaxID=1356565 RepID=A0ABU1U8C9_9MICC|nr:hypothetical protein [Arthrobacter ginsengisoli]